MRLLSFALLLAAVLAVCWCQEEFVCPEWSGYFPHEDCWKYYQCSANVAELFECPDVLVFDAEVLVCSWPDTTDCGDRNPRP